MSSYFAILRTLLHYLHGLNVNTGKTELFCLGSEKKLETFPYELKSH